MKSTLRFPDWYYGGPYLRVPHPDSDLPRRDPKRPVTPAEQTRVEVSGGFGGERLVAPFRDANSIEEIVTELVLASDYPRSWDDDERFQYPTIQGLLARLVLRLETKIRHTSGQVRANWFTLALADIRRSADLFAAGAYDQAQEHVRKAQSLVEEGNRVTRRKVSFLVGPDGSTSKV